MKLKKETPLITIVLLPFIYLAYIWNELPENVPLHWNLEGEIDRYGDKSELLIIPFVMPLLVYLIFLVVPEIDPKNKLNKMGNKLQSIKFLITTIMSILALFIIYSVKNQSIANPNYIILSIGLLFIILGNYFKTIKPNYFIGIRTPWTLENETVWKKTHTLGGTMLFIGGILILFSSLFLEKQNNFILFIVITNVVFIIPIVYSYLKFQKLKKQEVLEVERKKHNLKKR
ncbi:MAG: SdpI family protein [Flavobacteriaceae bacterium]|nr:SdpI family protein [Flavobacteriaceae bacterium]